MYQPLSYMLVNIAECETEKINERTHNNFTSLTEKDYFMYIDDIPNT